MSLFFQTRLHSNGTCQVSYNDYDGTSLSQSKQMEVDSDEECLAYGYDIAGFVAEDNVQSPQVCSIEQTDVVIASIKGLIQPFLMTELIIVVAVVAMRILKQLRPI
ncbi:hypothetical protein [Okeania sp. KiyG1]|uniref:hypothetical protein n=1 Tax=Okeania sp. KiyG1 TaxID=2720165 RepID=UPI0019225E7B|nr:hypothetical protein [Okeania sp. KiyG1]GGA14780.1 hypothetical protein CYANOKiyG1_28520 [Okeania sp. KiyG1]